MKPARIILLLIALVAGGLAAYLATRGQAPSPQLEIANTQTVNESNTQVLVAATPIGVGERLSATALRWQDWPEGALLPQYVTIESMPDALTELTGAVARFEIFSGEPIRSERLVRSEQGYLSAVLEKGMRGVSINVSTATGAGGFIVPNDRVDVVLTRNNGVGEMSETILSNVKILAIGLRLGEVGITGGQESAEDVAAKTFSSDTIATLELTPEQSERIINAEALGDLSLTLRSITDFTPDPITLATEKKSNSTTVRLIRFGQETAVLPSGNYSGALASTSDAGAFDPAPVNPADLVPQFSIAPTISPVPMAAPL